MYLRRHLIPAIGVLPSFSTAFAWLNCNSRFTRFFLMAVFMWLASGSLRAQVLLDHGVDPGNLGKGDWIYQVPASESRLNVSTTQALINYEAGMGMQWITVKCADGADTNDWTQLNPTLIAQAHAAGMKIFGWGYVYGNYSNNVPGEINAALTCLDNGADGFIVDAEAEYDMPGQANAASQYCQGIRARYPHTFLAFSTFYRISQHPHFPYNVFGNYCDAAMPEDYWYDEGVTPAQIIATTDQEWTAWERTNLLVLKPIVPIGETDSSQITGADVANFFNGIKNDLTPATAGGYNGISFWNSQKRTTNMDSALIAGTIGIVVPPVPVKFNAISFSDQGQIQLALSGKTGSTYAIDVSSNLVDWIQLITFTNATGSYQFMDGASTNRGQGYYRARLLTQ